MKVYRLDVKVIDFDEIGPEQIKDEIENARYGNHCINPKVMACDVRDIGEWRDDHPLNQLDKSDAEYHRLFKGAAE